MFPIVNESHQMYDRMIIWLCFLFFLNPIFLFYTWLFFFIGQSHLRCEDRYRAPVVYPMKRKRSLERGLTLEERLVMLFIHECVNNAANWKWVVSEVQHVLMSTCFQARAGHKQKHLQSVPESSTSTCNVQQPTEPHVQPESNTQPQQPSTHPRVLHTSHGRTACPHQETKKRCWKHGGQGQKPNYQSNPGNSNEGTQVLFVSSMSWFHER